MPLTDLPHEILAVVVHAALDGTPVPSDVLCVCRLIRDLGTHLQFSSAHQLRQFALSETPPIAPRALTVDLTGKAQRSALCDLCNVLFKCQRLGLACGADEDEVDDNVVRLKHVRLRMHSYTQDSAVDMLDRGLLAVSPETFAWTGPDPDHHFSTAIVPPVAACLFRRFSSWRNIREITVTNISFATSSDQEGRISPLLDNVPSLRALHIGQATFLHPHAVAGMFCQAEMMQLETVLLVDAYSESIWGARLRRSDIERAVSMVCRTEAQAVVIVRIKGVVRCEKKTERIMGGDRVEGTHILE